MIIYAFFIYRIVLEILILVNIMKALITGASSGLGRDIARLLSLKGYDLILVARRRERLEELKKEFQTSVQIFAIDVTDLPSILKMYEELKDQKIDVLINNAGFGLFGFFNELDLISQEEMLKTDVLAMQNLMRLFIEKFEKDGGGIILNIASFAAFTGGPLMATYYACKSYIYRLCIAINYELKLQESSVKISVMCPAPLKTEFQEKANVQFLTKTMASEKAAKIAVTNMGKKLVIFTSLKFKIARFLLRFIPEGLALRFAYLIQRKRNN